MRFIKRAQELGSTLSEVGRMGTWDEWPPGLRPLLWRNDFGAGLTNGESDEEGIEEFRLFDPSCRLNSAFSRSNAS